MKVPLLPPIVHTLTLRCALTIRADATEEALVRCLPTQPPVRTDNPFRRLGPYAPLRRFWWCGTDRSARSRKALRRFAALTTGEAEFVLVDEQGGLHGFRIQDGKLYRRDVVFSTRRKEKGAAPRTFDAEPPPPDLAILRAKWRALHEGEQARRAGKDPGDCPYPLDRTKLAACWALGWHAVDDSLARAEAEQKLAEVTALAGDQHADLLDAQGSLAAAREHIAELKAELARLRPAPGPESVATLAPDGHTVLFDGAPVGELAEVEDAAPAWLNPRRPDGALFPVYHVRLPPLEPLPLMPGMPRLPRAQVGGPDLDPLVLDALRTEGDAMSVGGLVAALGACGVTATPDEVRAALSRLEGQVHALPGDLWERSDVA